MNRVPVARHGLILSEDEATASRKLFKPLPGPPAPISDRTNAAKIKNPKNPKIHVKYGVGGMGGALTICACITKKRRAAGPGRVRT